MNLNNFSNLFEKGGNLFDNLHRNFDENFSELSFEDFKKKLQEMTSEDWNHFVEKCGDEWQEVVSAWKKGVDSLTVSWKELQEVWAINKRILRVSVDKLDMPTVVQYCKENRVKDAKSVALIIGNKQDSLYKNVYLAYLNNQDELLDVSQNIYIVFRCTEIDAEILNSVNNDNVVILK